MKKCSDKVYIYHDGTAECICKKIAKKKESHDSEKKQTERKTAPKENSD